jgi:uridylate kinase
METDLTGREPRHKRVLLKLSGESLMGNKPYGIDEMMLKS